MISAPCWTKLELGRPKEEKVKLVEGRVGMAANDNRTVYGSKRDHHEIQPWVSWKLRKGECPG